MTDTSSVQAEQQPGAPEQATEDQPQREVAELGEGGKKAIQYERDARRQAEEQVKQMQAQLESMKPLQEQMDKLRSAFGATPEQSSEDIVTTLQREVAEMRRDNLVNSVARQYGISEESDLAFLRDAGDPERMSALAQRLASVADQKTPGTPAPDAGQGHRQSPQSKEDAEYEQFFPETRK